MILLVDNYDSFVYNLRRYLIRLGQSVEVVRNDSVDFAAIQCNKYQAIVISPGPQGPEQAGACLELVNQFHQQIPILGICLGHQVLWQAFGGRVVRAAKPIHGRASQVQITHHSALFAGIINPFTAARYHSLVAEPQSVPKQFIITAQTDDGVVMACEHQSLPLFGLQFHPESILTDVGYRLLQNFLDIVVDTNKPQVVVNSHRTDNSDRTLPPSDLVAPPFSRQIDNEIWPDEGDDPAIAVFPGTAW